MNRARILGASVAAIIVLIIFASGIFSAETSNMAGEKRDLILTQSEREWLRQHPVVRVRISPGYPPFEFFDQGIFKGIEVDYLNIISRRLRVEFRPVYGELTWAEVLDRFRARDGVDLILGITRTAEREQYAVFTDDYISFPQVVFSRKDAPFIADIGELAGLRVAVERGYIMGSCLSRDVPGVRFVEVDRSEEALDAVATGKADAYVGNLAVGSYFIEKKGLVDLKVAAPTPYGADSMAMGVRRDWPELAALINKAIRSMGDEEHRAIRQRWLSLRYEHGLSVIDVIKWAAVVGAAALLWIIPLRMLVKRRTEELRQEIGRRRESEQKARAVLDQTFEFIGMLTPDGDLIEANRAALDFAGVRVSDVLGKPFWDTPWWNHSEEMQTKVREAIASAAKGNAVRFEATHRALDGAVRFIDLSLRPVYADNGSLLFLVPEGRDITEIKRAEESLRISEDRYHALFELAGDAILLLQGERFIDCNSKTLELFGCSREQIIDATPYRFSPPVQPDGRGSMEKALEKIRAAFDGTIQNFEWDHIRHDGSPFNAEVTLNKIDLASGPHLLAIVRDVSERKLAEEEKLQLQAQLQHAQKMEAIGQLAGGIAHDFNNMLTAIIGYGNLILLKLDKDSELKSYADQILSSAEKSANLTRQLLVFSRKQEIAPRITDLNDLIRGMEKLLRRFIGEDIRLKTLLSERALIAMADPGQIEQVLVNLTTNARDAMPDGGMLSISTNIEELDEGQIMGHGLEKPGLYGMISVSDTGSGMDEKTCQKIFEPFFTTKGVGRGTGLGLSIVYGIIKQHGGSISVNSEVDKGTTFRIYLPLVESRSDDSKATEIIMPKGGTETILLAEDNEDVRVLSRMVLEGHGYKVIEAADGEAVIDRFRENKDDIHLVMVDVIMPLKNGKEAVDEMKKIKPDIKVLYMSGYTSDIISRKGILEEGMDFISKPLKPNDLLSKIREILDS